MMKAEGAPPGPVLVPSFYLFGEPPQVAAERFLHVEAIADRSRPNDWNIRPHAHTDLNHIFHIVRGHGRMSVEGEAFPFAGPCLLLVPARRVHAFVFEPDIDGQVLTIAQTYLDDLIRREPGFEEVFAAPGVLALEPPGVSAELDQLRRELTWNAPAHAAGVEARLLAILVAALRLQHLANERGPVAAGPRAQLVARFREAVELHYRSPLGVEDYAAALGVSVSQLRNACLEAAGRTPLALIHARVLLEAKRALIYSNLSITEAAFSLGFEDPAYFSRFFSRISGESPRAFRDRMRDPRPAAAR